MLRSIARYYRFFWFSSLWAVYTAYYICYLLLLPINLSIAECHCKAPAKVDIALHDTFGNTD